MTDTPERPDGFEFPPPIPAEEPDGDAATTPTVRAATAEGLSAAVLRLPPLANQYSVAVAGAAIYTPDEAAGLVDSGGQLDPNRRADLDRRLTALVQQANCEYFRFELTRLHGPDDPTVLTLEHGDQVVSLTRHHSDRKLTVLLLLAVDGIDSALLTHPAAEEPQSITPGGAVVFPSYLVPSVDLNGHGSLRAVITHVTGPAFR